MTTTAPCPDCGCAVPMADGRPARCPECGLTFRADRPSTAVQSEPPVGRDRPDDDEEDDFDPRSVRLPAVGSDGGASQALVFAILGVVCEAGGMMCFFVTPFGLGFGIIGWVLAGRALRAMDEGRADPRYRGNAKAARVLGIVAVCLASLWLLFLAVMITVTALD